MSYPGSAAVHAAVETVAPRRDWVESVTPFVLLSGGLLSIGWTGVLVWALAKVMF